MSKKVATLLFAIGLGAASAPAFASCIYYCAQDRIACLASGWPADVCEAEFAACMASDC